MVDTFTPEQIAQILEEFFKVVGTRRYVGQRYVPIFGRKGEESIEWDNSAPYEPLTIVLYQGNSYTSRQYVPIGVDITNQEFWVITGNYNAQIEAYHRETIAAREIADNAITTANNAQNDIDTLLPKADFSAENTVKKYIDENPTRILTFDTVADMQAATNLLAGMTCHTNGFHASGDGGAAYYNVSASGTANGMDVLALQDDLFATLVVTEPYVTPEMFGAYGDGTTNDTACINRALEVSDTVKGASTYLIDQIIIASGKLVSGGEYLLNANVGFVLTTQSGLQNTMIRKADYPKLTDTSVGVKVIGGYNTLRNVNVEKCRYGYSFYNEQGGGCVYNSIENGILYDCVEHVYMKSDAASWSNENSFVNTSCRITGSYRSYVNRQEDAADYKAKYAVTLTHGTNTYNLNMNRFYNMSTEGCFNGFYVEGGKNLFVSCRTEENTKAYNFNKVTVSDRYNVIVSPYDTDPMERVQYTTSEDFAMYARPASTVIPSSGILMFDTSQHTTIDNATEKIYRTVSSVDGYTGIGVASNGTLNVIFSANYNYGMKSFYNFRTYYTSLAKLKALIDVSDGATFYASDLHKHVTYYGGKWWDESGAEV